MCFVHTVWAEIFFVFFIKISDWERLSKRNRNKQMSWCEWKTMAHRITTIGRCRRRSLAIHKNSASRGHHGFRHRRIEHRKGLSFRDVVIHRWIVNLLYDETERQCSCSHTYTRTYASAQLAWIGKYFILFCFVLITIIVCARIWIHIFNFNAFTHINVQFGSHMCADTHTITTATTSPSPLQPPANWNKITILHMEFWKLMAFGENRNNKNTMQMRATRTRKLGKLHSTQFTSAATAQTVHCWWPKNEEGNVTSPSR